MKQHEAVIKVMEQNGGFATLGYLNQEVLKVSNVEWKTKIPFASIRRIVQDQRFFFKIRPGLWALKEWEKRLPRSLQSEPKIREQERLELNHAYYQGLLIEIGNLKKYQTFIPNQDKNKDFLGRKLGDITSIKKFYKFGYDHFVHKAQTVDVSWFNSRNMPSILFEVEHSTDIQNSLLKFTELQDFCIDFFIIADNVRRKNYENKISLTAFLSIKKRVKFLDYERLVKWHTKTYEIIELESNLNILNSSL